MIDISWYFTQFDGLTKAWWIWKESFLDHHHFKLQQFSSPVRVPNYKVQAAQDNPPWWPLLWWPHFQGTSTYQYIPVHQSWSSDHPMFRVAVKTLQKHLHLESWLFLMGFRMFYSPNKVGSSKGGDKQKDYQGESWGMSETSACSTSLVPGAKAVEWLLHL